MKTTIIFALLILFEAPVFGQDEKKKSEAKEEVQYLNIIENGYEGNIVVDVVDENNVPVNDYRSILRSDDSVIFDLPHSGPRSTFFQDGSRFTIQIEKKGYQTYFSKPLTTDDQMEKACVIKIVLRRE